MGMQSCIDYMAELVETLKNWWGRYQVMYGNCQKTGGADYSRFHKNWLGTYPTSSVGPEMSRFTYSMSTVHNPKQKKVYLEKSLSALIEICIDLYSEKTIYCKIT